MIATPSPLTNMPDRLALWGAVGAAIWLIAVVIVWPALEAAILLLGPLVIVPLGLRLIGREHETVWQTRMRSIVGTCGLPAALVLLVSFRWQDRGLLSALLATPWLLITLLMAGWGGLRVLSRPLRNGADLAATAALLLIAVGGSWTLLSRAGIRPLDFSDAIVLLTGVHFHYAGFALPLLAGAAMSRLPPSRIMWPMLCGMLAGVPLVGVGISLSPLVEVLAALLLVVSCLLLAWAQIRLAIQLRQPNRSTLLLISSLSLLSAMLFAAIYAVGEFRGGKWLEIPTMIAIHGSTNAFGFALCGLLAHQQCKEVATTS